MVVLGGGRFLMSEVPLYSPLGSLFQVHILTRGRPIRVSFSLSLYLSFSLSLSLSTSLSLTHSLALARSLSLALSLAWPEAGLSA